MTSLRETIMDGVFDANHPIRLNELFELIKDKRPMSMTDVVSGTWNLQKTGELTFKERKGKASGGSGSEHHGGDLVDITLTPFGERYVRKRRGIEVGPPSYDRPFIKVTMDDVLEGTGMKPIERPKVEITDRLIAYKEPTAEKVVAAQILAESVGGKVTEERSGLFEPGEPRGFRYNPANRNTSTDKGSHPVGRDMTEARNHSWKAAGGPVTRTRVTPVKTPDQVAAVAAQVSAVVPSSAAVVPSSSAEQKDIGEKSLIASPVTDLATRFPQIWRIVTRETKVMEAARNLEEAGLDDLAVQAMEQLKFSDLEKEVIELVKEMT